MKKFINTFMLLTLLMSPSFSQAASITITSPTGLVCKGILKIGASIPVALLSAAIAINMFPNKKITQESESPKQPTSKVKIGAVATYFGGLAAYLFYRGIKDLKKAYKKNAINFSQ